MKINYNGVHLQPKCFESVMDEETCCLFFLCPIGEIFFYILSRKQQGGEMPSQGSFLKNVPLTSHSGNQKRVLDFSLL